MADPAKRGRLSSLDTLPEWADEAKLWAFGELKARQRPQLEILEEFNAKLRAAAWEQGISDAPQISKSAFNRVSMRLAVLGRRLEETREIANVLAPKLDQAGDASVTLLVAESIKMLVHEMLSNAGDLSADGDTAEMLMLTSRALKHAEEAKRISADGRRKIEAEFKEKTGKVIEKVGQEAGLSAERIAQLRRDFLGVRPKADGDNAPR